MIILKWQKQQLHVLFMMRSLIIIKLKQLLSDMYMEIPPADKGIFKLILRAVYEVGMTGVPVYNVNNNCATGSTALHLAKNFV
jgi:acetyl-CoA acetyltransferase